MNSLRVIFSRLFVITLLLSFNCSTQILPGKADDFAVDIDMGEVLGDLEKESHSLKEYLSIMHGFETKESAPERVNQAFMEEHHFVPVLSKEFLSETYTSRLVAEKENLKKIVAREKKEIEREREAKKESKTDKKNKKKKMPKHQADLDRLKADLAYIKNAHLGSVPYLVAEILPLLQFHMTNKAALGTLAAAGLCVNGADAYCDPSYYFPDGQSSNKNLKSNDRKNWYLASLRRWLKVIPSGSSLGLLLANLNTITQFNKQSSQPVRNYVEIEGRYTVEKHKEQVEQIEEGGDLKNYKTSLHLCEIGYIALLLAEVACERMRYTGKIYKTNRYLLATMITMVLRKVLFSVMQARHIKQARKAQ